MPPPLIVQLERVDLGQVLVTREEIYDKYLPQRHEFMLLSGVCAIEHDPAGIVAFADVNPDDWWVRGHVPGRPLLPGVLMLEMAAQTSALGGKLVKNHTGFIGYGGVDACKFRESVSPPVRLYLLATAEDYRPRRIISRTQGVIDNRLIFEAKITGLTLPD